MTPRWNRTTHPTRTIHCAVVEAPAMSDPFDPRPRDGFRDLVPWADPYIAALIAKLRRAADCDARESAIVDELNPPLESRENERDGRWPGEWTPRNWPRD
jgi:hypothetical protein